MSDTIPNNLPEKAPEPIQFNQLSLPNALLTRLDEMGYQQMTRVQSLSLPIILNNADAVVHAETGSGKTTAFALALLSKLDTKSFAPQALVLCPTRELAQQVADEVRKLAKSIANIKVLSLCGGEPTRIQTHSLEHGAHVLVGTPGRVLDHLQQRNVDLSTLTTLILDEADRMLEMGFQESLNAIIEHTPKTRQTLLFSATYPQNIATLATQVTTKAAKISAVQEDNQPKIKQLFYAMDNSDSAQMVMNVLAQQQPENCLIFCNTKNEVKDIFNTLSTNNFSVLALHGELEQKDRDQAIIQFSNGSVRVLVATDVASRGLDIAELDLVISVNMAHDLDTHTHRIGRTGRAGKEGVAITLIGAQDDYKMRLLEDTFAEPIEVKPAPPLSHSKPLKATMTTLQLSGGKKDKLRPGDVVGVLTKDNVLSAEDIGKIKLESTFGFVAVNSRLAKHALELISNNKIKGKRFRAKLL
ncbi:ATP-dependent RNA helicase DbpA [Idiomarina sp. HP20-50]|uniref:ATP-dependent RNA helicase DbpA n=1 Tax=Idiomarina sp. HP20-50 TaxID=3070813 RepID=UPI00294B64D0|nr:ATP-dependent RNA helicase DbpA [Idiomarina sp. HP20-50]MDV6314997.1 ATP-dependent RNA helicase DbpA [Idiomarina sp. HP20-50]